MLHGLNIVYPVAGDNGHVYHSFDGISQISESARGELIGYLGNGGLMPASGDVNGVYKAFLIGY